MIDVNTPIWRYQNFFKFFDWVASRKMYFSRVDEFKDDRWECVIPDAVLQPLLKSLQEDGFDDQRRNKIRNQYDRTNILRPSNTFVSSWCFGEDEKESDLMWRAYCRGQPGIAVKSTPQIVKESLAGDQQHSQFVKVESVKYYDPTTVENDLSQREAVLKESILAKRIAFAGDNECRFFIEWNEIQKNTDKPWVDPPEKCLRVECNVQNCFNEIVLSPGLQKPHLEAIQDFVKGYGIDPTIVRLSRIDEQFDQLIARNAPRV